VLSDLGTGQRHNLVLTARVTGVASGPLTPERLLPALGRLLRERGVSRTVRFAHRATRRVILRFPSTTTRRLARPGALLDLDVEQKRPDGARITALVRLGAAGRYVDPPGAH
jgi:hypothetical protein